MLDPPFFHSKVNTGGFGVKDMMDTWTRQMGLPYINISLKTEGAKTVVTATQTRFLANKETVFDPEESPFRYITTVYRIFIVKISNSYL